MYFALILLFTSLEKFVEIYDTKKSFILDHVILAGSNTRADG